MPPSDTVPNFDDLSFPDAWEQIQSCLSEDTTDVEELLKAVVNANWKATKLINFCARVSQEFKADTRATRTRTYDPQYLFALLFLSWRRLYSKKILPTKLEELERIVGSTEKKKLALHLVFLTEEDRKQYQA